MKEQPNFKLVFLSLLICLGILQGCSRNSAPQPTILPEVKNFDFSYSSCLVENYPVKFKSTLSDSLHYFWNFGDGGTSMAPNPEHSYPAPGTYTVALTINGHATSTLYKTIIVTKNPIYTSLAGGMRLWHHTRHYSDSIGIDTVYSFSDTSFAVIVVDPLTVAVGTDTMSYIPQLSIGDILYFRKIYNYASTETFITSLSYNRTIDSARYDQSSTTAQSWNKTSYVTP